MYRSPPEKQDRDFVRGGRIAKSHFGNSSRGKASLRDNPGRQLVGSSEAFEISLHFSQDLSRNQDPSERAGLCNPPVIHDRFILNISLI